MANSYLGEHRTFNGKLMRDLRGKRGLNYGDYSYIEDFIQQGGSTFPVPNNPRRQQYFSIWIRPVPSDKSVFAFRAALWDLNRLVDRGMTNAEFEETRSFLLNYSKLWVQTLSRRLGYVIDGGFYGRKDLVTELAERLPKLTVDQVNAAVRKYLKPEGMKSSSSPATPPGSASDSFRGNPRRSATTPKALPRTSWPRTSKSQSSRSRMSACGSSRSSRCSRSSTDANRATATAIILARSVSEDSGCNRLVDASGWCCVSAMGA